MVVVFGAFLSELIIIEEIMFRIQGREQLKEVPLPADYFDLIGGTSTGGWTFITAFGFCVFIVSDA